VPQFHYQKSFQVFLCLQITQFHHKRFVQFFLWSFKLKTNPPFCIKNLPRLKQTCHYAFMSSQYQNKLPLHAFVNFQNQTRPPLCAFVNSQNQNRHHHAFVSSQDENRSTVQIHELLNPQQTHIIWTSKTKTNLNYAFVNSHGQMRTPLCIFVDFYNKIKCSLCIFVSSQTKSNSHYIYNLWGPKTKIGPQYAFVSSFTFSHFVFSCKVFNLSHPHMLFMIAWKNSLIPL
jgi:hypothetical protein